MSTKVGISPFQWQDNYGTELQSRGDSGDRIFQGGGLRELSPLGYCQVLSGVEGGEVGTWAVAFDL